MAAFDRAKPRRANKPGGRGTDPLDRFASERNRVDGCAGSKVLWHISSYCRHVLMGTLGTMVLSPQQLLGQAEGMTAVRSIDDTGG
jgi:hypothetical protein